MEVAALGVSVNSNADKATVDLNSFAAAAKRAEAASTGLAGGSKVASAAAENVSATATRAASALNVEATAATKAAAAMHVHGKAVNDNTRRMGGSMSGLAAQFQDIGVTAAMGMNPMIIALQQGTQIAGQMEMAMQGGAKATDVLGTAFRSLFSPLTFITIALTALSVIGLQMVDWPALAASALTALASVLQTIAPYAAIAAAGLALLYAPAIVMGIVSTIALLGRLAVAAVIAAGAMAAANPALALVAGITIAVAAANIFRDEITRIFGVDIVGAAKTGANYVIGSFVAAYEDIKFVWNNFGNIIGAAITGAVNAVVDGVNTMIQKAASGVDWLIDKLNQIPGVNLEKIGSVGDIVPKWQNDYAAKAAAAVDGRNKAVADALNRDYLGDFGADISRGASAASDKLKELAKWITTVDDKKKKKGPKTDAEKYSDIVADANNRILALKAEQAGLGMTEEAAAKLRYEQELLNKAQQAGITLTSAQKAELASLAGQMAATEIATRKAKEAMNFAKDVTRGFIEDFRSGLEQGKSFWESFANAALNAMDKIVDKLLNDVLDALFKVNNSGSGGGFWGFLSSLFGGGFKVTPGAGLYAAGGYTGNGPASAAAGIVHGGEYVFSKRATDRIGVGTLETIHSSAKGYANGGYVGQAMPRMQAAANGNQGGSQSVRVSVGVSVDDDGKLRAYVRSVSQETTSDGIDGFSRTLPDHIEAYQADPRRRRA